MSARTGYTTGTFDMLHRGHIALLAHIRARCDFLILGLTTDRLAKIQKRQTMMPWEDRKAVLENMRQVDLVVAHDGDSKETAHAKLKFDICFIGDDYYDVSEYRDFTATPVVYHPRTPFVSSRELVRRNLSHLLCDNHLYLTYTHVMCACDCLPEISLYELTFCPRRVTSRKP
jgi:glycerol-3-phosphate cytidylyltransferase